MWDVEVVYKLTLSEKLDFLHEVVSMCCFTVLSAIDPIENT
jgi:hypothetical protein